MWFSRPKVPVGCEEQVSDAKCTRPCEGAGTQTSYNIVFKIIYRIWHITLDVFDATVTQTEIMMRY